MTSRRVDEPPPWETRADWLHTAPPTRTTVPNPYTLLGVPVDASQERIRRAYELEVNRAHRAGATRHAVELSKAYDTLSVPSCRALYDRHGLAAVRERSPGALRPPTPWRIAKHQPIAVQPAVARRGPRNKPLLLMFSIGILVGLIVAAYFLRLTVGTGPTPAGALVPQHQILCPTTAHGVGYVYSASVTSVPYCSNGAAPHVLG